MPGPIFDTHAHYTSAQFDADRAALLAGLPEQGVVGVVDCAVDYATSLQSLQLARQYPWLWAAAGIHPESLIQPKASTLACFGGDWRAEMAQLRPLYADPKVVAVGEVGLDYHWPVPRDEQLALFEASLRLALEVDKPVIVHDRQAHADVYALLKNTAPGAWCTAFPAARTTRCGWRSRACTSVLAARSPSRGPRGRSRPPRRFRWRPSCWRPTALT